MLDRAALAALLLVFAAAPARSELHRGDRCVASSPVPIRLERKLQTTVEKGDRIEVIKPGRFFTRVLVNNDVEGSIATPDLEAVCTPQRETCTLTAPIKMTEEATAVGKRRAFKVKAGAKLEVLERGDDDIARVKVGDLIGLVREEDLDERCRPEGAAAEAKRGFKPVKDAIAKRLPELPKVDPVPAGVFVVVLPFALGPGLDKDTAALVEDELARALNALRVDAMGVVGPRAPAEERDLPLKDHLLYARRLGAAMGAGFVLTGRLELEPKKVGGEKADALEDPEGFEASARIPEEDKGPPLILSLALLDVEASKVVQGLRARPTLHPDDPWAETALRVVGKALPPEGERKAEAEAPGVKAPAPSTTKPAPKRPTGDPWYANGLAYTALGAAALAAAGGVTAGTLAYLDGERYRALAPSSPERSTRYSEALAKGIVADGLYAAAAVLTAAAGVFFVTGLDYDGFPDE